MKGKCKLCLRDGMMLCDSHYMPKAAYRLVHREANDNEHPIVIGGETVLQTSEQLKAFLLCRDCEHLFHQKGENWFFRHCLRVDGRFRLQQILAEHKPFGSEGPATDIYRLASIPEIDVFPIVFFASSIFWRGAIHPWNEDRTIPVKLGPFEEQLRQFLLGETPFPINAALQVTVMKGRGQYEKLFFPPLGDRQDTFHRFKFHLGGFGFVLTTGKRLPEIARRLCVLRGVGNPIISSTLLDKFAEHEAVRKITADRKLLWNFVAYRTKQKHA